MGSFFSRKKEPEKPPITEQDKAVLALKHQRDKLKKYQKKIEQNVVEKEQIENNLEKERQLAKELLQQGKKNKAKFLLKKKRYQEQLLERTDNQLENLEKMTQDIEFAQVQIQVAEGLKKGNECLHQLHEIMSIEEVERIMEDTKEAVEYQKEIDDLLSGGLSDEDNDAILKELDELSESVTAEKLPEVPKDELNINLPEAPTKEPGEAQNKVHKETKEREMVAA